MSNREKNLDLTPIKELLDFSGKSVLITGGATGIGLAIATRFAEVGARLILVDKDARGLSDAQTRLSKEKISVEIHSLDLSSKTAIDSLWSSLDDTELPDILVNNAGVFPIKDFLEADESFLATAMDVNFNATFWMCQHFIKRRKKQGGGIVNISSIEAMVAFKSGMAHYASAKAGVMALTRALARDYGKRGYRVNAILPGGVQTPGTTKLARQALMKADLGLIKTSYDFRQRLSIGRIGKPDDIAKVVVFLASDLASYVQGACLPVDGGFLAS